MHPCNLARSNRFDNPNGRLQMSGDVVAAALIRKTYNVSAYCQQCRTTTSFEKKHSIQIMDHERGRRINYVLSQCASCKRGGYAEISDHGTAETASLEDFYPISYTLAAIPESVPKDIKAEFREAERCAAFLLNRAASALFRSVLEKTLKANGYTKANDPKLSDLYKRIDAAAADGVITQARQKKAHEDIRSLGNDVLHDEWREVTKEEVETAHKYMQRILEDLYDDRATVETVLIDKNRISK
jgi:Domain of unknown function (DUF4145)